MDLDISDILADVSRPRPRDHDPSSSSSSHNHLLDPNSTATTDHQLLLRTWTNERNSPSLLPYPTALLERTMERIRSQITRIEDLTAGVPGPSSSVDVLGLPTNVNLVLSILQTDLSRTQFIVRSYLRQRLGKLGRYAMFYLTTSQQQQQQQQQQQRQRSAADQDPLLSNAELDFLRNHQSLLSQFYDDAFLGSFPANMKRLDDRNAGLDMLEGPDLAGVVFVRCLATSWDSAGDEVLAGLGGEDGGRGATGEKQRADVELRMRKGEVWVVRFRDVRLGVLGGELELL